MSNIVFRDITATTNGDRVTVTATYGDKDDPQTVTATMWQSHLDTLNDKEKAAFVKERLMKSIPNEGKDHDLGFTTL